MHFLHFNKKLLNIVIDIFILLLYKLLFYKISMTFYWIMIWSAIVPIKSRLFNFLSNFSSKTFDLSYDIELLHLNDKY